MTLDLRERFVNGLGHQAHTHTHRGWVGRIGAPHALAMHSMQFFDSRDTNIVS